MKSLKKITFDEVIQLKKDLFYDLKQKGFKRQLAEEYVKTLLIEEGYKKASLGNRVVTVINDFAKTKNIGIEELSKRLILLNEVKEVFLSKGYDVA